MHRILRSFVIISLILALAVSLPGCYFGETQPHYSIKEDGSAVLIGRVPVGSYKAEYTPPTYDSTEIRYGRNALAELENGENLVEAYDRIYSSADSDKVAVDLQELNLTKEQLDTVWCAYQGDSPEHFAVDRNFNYSYQEETTVISMALSYVTDLQDKQEVFDQAVESYLQQVTDVTEPAEIALRLHDLLAADITYTEDTVAPYAHTAYGALVEHQAVCDGYSKAYQLLLGRMGISSVVIGGEGQEEPHAWNAVELPLGWVYTDLTWDDADPNLYHCYYGLTTEQISEDHTADELGYPIPLATTTAYYGIPVSRQMDALQLDDIIALLRQGKDGKTAACQFRYAGEEDVDQFLEKNFQKIAKGLSFYGTITWTSQNLNHEYILTYTVEK